MCFYGSNTRYGIPHLDGCMVNLSRTIIIVFKIINYIEKFEYIIIISIWLPKVKGEMEDEKGEAEGEGDCTIRRIGKYTLDIEVNHVKLKMKFKEKNLRKIFNEFLLII